MCDSDLWNHVYEKDRLHVVEQCMAVEGRVRTLHRESDGDLHIGVDPVEKSTLNLFNMAHAHGRLVVEVVCEHHSADPAAKAACEGFRSEVMIPNVGDRVRITGAYVTDGDYGWAEIHPVTSMEILPRP